MAERTHSTVFLSYARADGENFAESLRERFRREAPDIAVRQDRLFLEGGIGWWKQITDAIDSADFLVLVMTPGAMNSEVVRKEWIYARQQGVCVYPVKAVPDDRLEFSSLPGWMRKVHFFDLGKEWATFVQHLRSPCTARRVAFMAPDLPASFVQRPVQFSRIRTCLIDPGRDEPVAITTSLAGAGGFGKTTLAAAICHDPDIIRNFDDGILWVTLGQTPDLVAAMLTIYAALTGDRPGFASVEDAAFQLARKLQGLNCLLVIDDVWNSSHLRPFLRATGCARLFTTRDSAIASQAVRVTVDEMSESEALALLKHGINAELSEFRSLSRMLGEWPLALELARASIERRVLSGDTSENAIQYVERALGKKGLTFLIKDTAEARHQTIAATLALTTDLLSALDRQRLCELAIFPEDIQIPVSAAGALWGTDEFDTGESAQTLARLSLLKLDLQRGTIGLHDVLRSWFARGVTNPAELHGRLVDAWPDWHNLPDTYAWEWLTWHLAQAGRHDDLIHLLWDPVWLPKKLEHTGPNSLIRDFGRARPDREAGLVHRALELSSHVLARDKVQLMGQLWGRLLRCNVPRTREMVRKYSGPVWFRPLVASLDGPGTALLRSFAGHAGFVNDVALYADGRRAISAADDKTLKLWDLDTGEELRTLSGHTSRVSAVAVCADGRRAISASSDDTLRLWDLETGRELRVFHGHSKHVSSVALHADGRRIVSGSGDGTLRVWDIDSGRELRVLSGHKDTVSAVALCADGRQAVSGSWDGTLKIWDLEAGNELRTLSGHPGWWVEGVAVFANDRRAISASNDHTLKVWSLDTGEEVYTLRGHTNWIETVTVCSDGHRAVSGSRDDTLKVWNLDTGEELRTFRGHSSFVNAIAVHSDGRRAISGSTDKTMKLWNLEGDEDLQGSPPHEGLVIATAVYDHGRRAVSAATDLKLWDLETGKELCRLTGHTSGVVAVAVFAGGRRAISASGDSTLRVWDLESGAELRTLRGHRAPLSDVAVGADGRRAISASWDSTLKLWDLDSGEALHTLEGHTGMVNAVAVSPDGRRAISASNDSTVRVWDLFSGQHLSTLRGHHDILYDVKTFPDNRRAISAGADGTLKVWNLDTGEALHTLRGHRGRVTAIAVCGDGRRVVSSSYDQTLKVWDIDTGRELHTLRGHTNWVDSVAVFADGNWAISGSTDGTLKLWDLKSGKVLANWTVEATLYQCALAEHQKIAVVGDLRGRVHMLRIETPVSNDHDACLC